MNNRPILAIFMKSMQPFGSALFESGYRCLRFTYMSFNLNKSFVLKQLLGTKKLFSYRCPLSH